MDDDWGCPHLWKPPWMIQNLDLRRLVLKTPWLSREIFLAENVGRSSPSELRGSNHPLRSPIGLHGIVLAQRMQQKTVTRVGKKPCQKLSRTWPMTIELYKFMAGTVTIPSHGWFMTLLWPQWNIAMTSMTSMSLGDNGPVTLWLPSYLAGWCWLNFKKETKS